MRRRIGLGLLVALGVLVAPAAASITGEHRSTDAHSASKITVSDRHATVVRVVAPRHGGRERRAPQHLGSAPAVFAGAVGLAPAVAWARLDLPRTAPTGDFPGSSRPRAPPAVV